MHENTAPALTKEVDLLPSRLPSTGLSHLGDTSGSIDREQEAFSVVAVVKEDVTSLPIGDHLVPGVSPSSMGLEQDQVVGINSEDDSFVSGGIIHEEEVVGSNDLLPASSPSGLLKSQVQAPVVTDGVERSLSVVSVIEQDTGLSSNGNSDNLVPGVSPSGKLGLLDEVVVLDFENEPLSRVLIVEESSLVSVRVGDFGNELPGGPPSAVIDSIGLMTIASCNVTSS